MSASSSASANVPALKKIVIVGGGLGGLVLAKQLSNKNAKRATSEITIVTDRPFFHYNIAAVRGIVDAEFGAKTLFNYRELLPESVKLVFGKASEIASNEDILKVTVKKEKEAEEEAEETTTTVDVAFDALVLATGSRYNGAWKAESSEISAQADLYKSISAAIEAASTIAVIGGGSTGVEAAAEILFKYPSKKVTIVHPGQELLDNTNSLPKGRRFAHQWFTQRGATVLLGNRVTNLQSVLDNPLAPHTLEFKSGENASFDLVIAAAGSKPNTEWLRSETGRFGTPETDVLTEHNRVKIDPFFRVANTKNIFALGDIIQSADPQTGFAAGEQAKAIVGHLQRWLQGQEPNKPWKGVPAMILVSLGPQDGIMSMPCCVATGFLPKKIKASDMFLGKFQQDNVLPTKKKEQ